MGTFLNLIDNYIGDSYLKYELVKYGAFALILFVVFLLYKWDEKTKGKLNKVGNVVLVSAIVLLALLLSRYVFGTPFALERKGAGAMYNTKNFLNWIDENFGVLYVKYGSLVLIICMVLLFDKWDKQTKGMLNKVGRAVLILVLTVLILIQAAISVGVYFVN